MALSPVAAHSPFAGLSPDQALSTFKFYEEAAEKSKSHAWAQTTWILTLNAAILAFSVSFYAEHADNPAFIIVEALAWLVGFVLCAFLAYLLEELGSHISHYWTSSNMLAAAHEQLAAFVGEAEVSRARERDYRASFPPFCRRLQLLALMFAVAHAGWLVVVITTVT